MAVNLKNFAYSFIDTPPTPANSGTSLGIGAGTSGLFPPVPFNVTVWPAGAQPTAANAEVMRVTANASDVFTVVRTQEGSSARTIDIGDQIAATITAGVLSDLVNNQSLLNNFSTTSQSPAAATRTYVDGSQIAVPPGGLRVGTMFRWVFSLTKTAAGSASSTFDVAFGTAGTTSDTARLSFTKPAGTAAADEGRVVIEAVVRGPLSGSGVVVGEFTMTHNLSATGHMTIPCANVLSVSGAFDVTTPTFVGVCLTTGAADAVSIELATAEARNI